MGAHHFDWCFKAADKVKELIQELTRRLVIGPRGAAICIKCQFEPTVYPVLVLTMVSAHLKARNHPC